MGSEAVPAFVITDGAIPDDEVVELVLAGEVGHEVEKGVLALSELAEDESEAVIAEDAHGFSDPCLAPGEVVVGSWPLGVPGFIFENVEVRWIGDDGLGDGVREFLEFLEGVALDDAVGFHRGSTALWRVRLQALGRTGGFFHFVFGGLGDHVFEGGTGGDHGEDVFVFDALGLDDAGTVVIVEGLLEDAGDIGRAADVEAFDAVGFAEFDEVGVAEQIDAAFAVVEEQLLPLADHAEVAVVEDDDFDGQLVNGGGGQFKQGHLEAAVARDGGNDFVWAGELSADGGGETEAHGAGTAGAEPMVAGVVFVELGGPHLVLAHVGGDDGFAFGELVELVDDLLHAQAALFFVAEGEFLFVAVEVGEPVFGGEFFDERQEVAESGFGVAFDGDVDLDHFVELGSVDVDVDEFGVAAKHVGFADDAVVEAGADVEDEVGFADGFVGVGGAVHAEHAEGERVGFGEDAFAEEGGGNGAAEGFGEHEKFFVGAGDHGTLAGEDDGAFGL